jgi:hypothetical protein
MSLRKRFCGSVNVFHCNHDFHYVVKMAKGVRAMSEKLAKIARSCEEEYLAAIHKPTSTYQQRTELRLKWEAACQAMTDFINARRETVG